MNGKEITSEGYGFEADLPQKVVLAGSSGPSPISMPPYAPWPQSVKVGIPSFIMAIPMLMTLRAMYYSRRQRRRVKKGLCEQCAYDTRFSPDRCPECGTLVSAGVQRRIIRKCICRIVLTFATILFIATTVFWIRSYHVADCWTRTTAERSDSVYFSRGAIVLNLLTTVNQPGWFHDAGRAEGIPTIDGRVGRSVAMVSRGGRVFFSLGYAGFADVGAGVDDRFVRECDDSIIAPSQRGQIDRQRLNPGGIAAISRRLSRAIPPGCFNFAATGSGVGGL
jgi:hypothetical protein